MRTLSNAIVTVALSSLSRAVQVRLTDTNVTAGNEFEVTIINATEVPAEWDRPIDASSDLQIGVRNTVYNSWMCSLTERLTTKDDTIKVTIPTSIGPSGAYYQLSARIFRSDAKAWEPYVYGDWGPQIFLSNAAGTWTPAEVSDYLDDTRLGLEGYDRSDIPCTSYPCARKCADEHFPDERAWVNKTTSWIECLESCEGVVIDYDKLEERSRNRTIAPTRIEVPDSVPTPTGTGAGGSCRAEEFRTPCGGTCCGYSTFCMGFEKCQKLPGYCEREGESDEGEFRRCEDEKGEGGTSGAVVMGVEWKGWGVVVLGIMAGVAVGMV